MYLDLRPAILYVLYRMHREVEPMPAQFSLTNARAQLSTVFNRAVRDERPSMISRQGGEQGVLMSRAALLRLLEHNRFHVDVLPEDDGSITLWVRELDLGENAPTLREARAALIESVKQFVADYEARFGLYRHFTDWLAREPYVRRLSLAQDDEEVWAMLAPAPETGSAEPSVG